jgi:translocation and assembly module TamB
MAHAGGVALRIGKWVAIAVAALAAFAVLAVFGLNSTPGRRFVTQQLNGFETAAGLKIGVGRLDGSLYGKLTIRDLTLSDPKGVFARAPVVALDWRPFAYANGKIDVRDLAIPTATFARLPELKPSADPDAPLLPDIDLAVGRLRVGRLVLEAPVTGKRSVLQLAGAADIADGRARLKLDAAALREAQAAGGDRLALTLDAVPADNRLVVSARAEGAGRRAGRQLCGARQADRHRHRRAGRLVRLARAGAGAGGRRADREPGRARARRDVPGQGTGAAGAAADRARRRGWWSRTSTWT